MLSPFLVDSLVNSLAFISMPGGWEWIVIIFIGLLLFGRRLPEVGRSIGRTIVEFKKGVKGIEDEVNSEVEESERRDAERRRLAADEAQRAAQATPPAEPRTIPTTDHSSQG